MSDNEKLSAKNAIVATIRRKIAYDAFHKDLATSIDLRGKNTLVVISFAIASIFMYISAK